jgi:hypothetical protein
MTPGIHELLYNSGIYNVMPPNILAYGDQLYYIWIAMIFVIPLVIIIRSWREAEQRAREG